MIMVGSEAQWAECGQIWGHNTGADTWVTDIFLSLQFLFSKWMAKQQILDLN